MSEGDSLSCEVSLSFLSVGCNRVVGCADLLHHAEGDLLAYGASSLVIIADSDNSRVLTSLRGHKGRVNCVRWLRFRDDDDVGIVQLATASSDGAIVIWIHDKATKEWKQQLSLAAHTGSVTYIAAFARGAAPCGRTLASVSTDRTIGVWDEAAPGGSIEEPSGWSLSQRLDHPPTKSPLCAALFPAPWGQPGALFLATGHVDTTVRLLGRVFEPNCLLDARGTKHGRDLPIPLSHCVTLGLEGLQGPSSSLYACCRATEAGSIRLTSAKSPQRAPTKLPR